MNDDKDKPAKERPGFFRRLFVGIDEPADPRPLDQPPQAETAPQAEQATEAAKAEQVAEAPKAEPPRPRPSLVDLVKAEIAERSAAPSPEPPKPAEPPRFAEPPKLAEPPKFAEPREPAEPKPVPVPDLEPRAEPAPQPDIVAEAPVEVPGEAPRSSWWSRLKAGLSRSSSSIGTGITDIFTKRKLDASTLEDLEDVLIRADLGVATAGRIAEAVGKGRYDKSVAPDEVRAILADEVERVLSPYARPIETAAKKPFVILVVGVNGSGKTTTIGKLAAKFSGEGKSVLLAAGDTFRAAAIAQLRIWGERLGCEVVAREQGSDPAGLAFDAIERARAAGTDVLLMDTAGRLQNRTELMAELEKIIRVMRKLDPEAPHAVLLVLDATVGQNAMSQVEIFGKVAGVTGLVMTKLDGTARGGILVAIADKFKLPIHFIGVGETADDLEPFAARDFAHAIAGIGRED